MAYDPYCTKMRTTYEWCIEQFDASPEADPDDPDILDTPEREAKLRDLPALAAPGEASVGSGDLLASERLVLVKERGSQAEGLQEREYAYVQGGALPEHFEEGSRVPKRFHAELAKSGR